jgi:mRNA interferase MazF
MRRGEVWWAAWPHLQRHPVLLLSWDAHGDWRDQVTVAEVTSMIRGLDAEVSLGRRDGMPRRCVVNLDRIVTLRRSLLSEQLCSLSAERMREVERAIHLALGITLPCRFGS